MARRKVIFLTIILLVVALLLPWVLFYAFYFALMLAALIGLSVVAGAVSLPIIIVYLSVLAVLILLIYGIVKLVRFKKKRKHKKYYFKPLPLVVFAFVFGVTSLIWYYVSYNQSQEIHGEVITKAIDVRHLLKMQLTGQHQALDRMAKRWQRRSGTPQQEWIASAQDFIDHHSGVQAVLWVDNRLKVRWQALAGSGQNTQHSNIYHDQSSRSSSSNGLSQSDKIAGDKPTLDGQNFDIKEFSPKSLHELVNTKIGLKGLMSYSKDNHGLMMSVPVYNGKSFDGYIVTLTSIPSFFEAALNSESMSGYTFAVYKDGSLTYTNSKYYHAFVGIPGSSNLPVSQQSKERGVMSVRERELQDSWAKTVKVQSNDIDWTLKIWPTDELLRQEGSHLPHIILAMGLMFGFLLMLLTHYFKISQVRAKELAGKNDALRKEVTGRKRAEKISLRLEEVLQQKQKLHAIGTLAGGIAHDFNNILYAMMGYVQMARDDASDEQTKANLDKVIKAGERGQKLINGILTFSRQEDHEFQVVDLVEVVEHSDDLVRPSIPVDMEFEVTSVCATAMVWGSAPDLEQVLVNMVNNAIDACHGKGKIAIVLFDETHADPELSRAISDRPNHFCIMVKDDGEGMDEETVQKLFEPFFTTKEVGEGTGLGLARAHGIIDNHKGEIIANSKLGKGSTFYIFLPKYAKGDEHG